MCGFKVIVLTAILGILVTTTGWAVGYERLEVPQNPKVTKTVITHTTSNGSFLQKCPALLDDTAAVIKDILSQFGLLDKKTP
jgi:hypothetical protein